MLTMTTRCCRKTISCKQWRSQYTYIRPHTHTHTLLLETTHSSKEKDSINHFTQIYLKRNIFQYTHKSVEN